MGEQSDYLFPRHLVLQVIRKDTMVSEYCEAEKSPSGQERRGEKELMGVVTTPCNLLMAHVPSLSLYELGGQPRHFYLKEVSLSRRP